MFEAPGAAYQTDDDELSTAKKPARAPAEHAAEKRPALVDELGMAVEESTVRSYFTRAKARLPAKKGCVDVGAVPTATPAFAASVTHEPSPQR
jgi:hypothetical protein